MFHWFSAIVRYYDGTTANCPIYLTQDGSLWAKWIDGSYHTINQYYVTTKLQIS